ncbi:MAG: 23S rRNA (adenine(2030)-N(6))-methyltransferase RlmJ [Betaproteobacteria bacterium]|nr:23S rRNA (adenine(2030)-N(6))-methyltransferase RlmJ [Betaproteobacteria bacterium]
MFSYRHAFHAGNHADVLKHVVLLEVLQYACQKEAAVFYIDTHAGAALYPLLKAEAQKNREFESGIGRLWGQSDIPAELQAYMKIIRELNPDGVLRYYPGSPYFAESVLRDQDRLRLFELHSTESRILAENFNKIQMHAMSNGQKRISRGKRVMIEKKDGFAALKSQLPPLSRRAVILIDPPYENKQDYRHVIEALSDAVKRFSSGTYIVWYPILQRPEARRFPDRLKSLPGNEWLEVTLTVSQPVPDRFGLYGSGLFVINPPWTLKARMELLMPRLVSLLGQDGSSEYSLLTGAGKPVKRTKEDD